MEVTTFVQIPLEQYEALKKERDDFQNAIHKRKNVSYIFSSTRFNHYIDEQNEHVIKSLEDCICRVKQQLDEKEKIIDSLIIENARLKQRKKRWLW